MPEVVIKYKSARALKALKDLAKVFDITIESLANSQGIPINKSTLCQLILLKILTLRPWQVFGKEEILIY